MNKLHYVFIGVTVFFVISLLEIEPPFEAGHFLWAIILAPIWVIVAIRDRKNRTEKTIA